jgi:hypothetical protein
LQPIKEFLLKIKGRCNMEILITIGISIVTSTIISLIFMLPEYFKIKKQIDKMFEKKLKELR